LLDVEGWAELRREHFVRGVAIKELARRTGMSRNTIRSALRSQGAPRYSRPAAGSKLDPFKDEIHRLLRADPRRSGQRIRELIAPLGFDGGKTIVDDYLREVRVLLTRHAPMSARSIARVRSVSSISGSRGLRSRSVMARLARAGWSSRARGTRARAPGR
jgi:hypothetical protein